MERNFFRDAVILAFAPLVGVRAAILVAVVLAVASILAANTQAVEIRSYTFQSDGSRPLKTSGGLLGSFGDYDIVGTLNLHMDEVAGTAWFSDVNLALEGDAGSSQLTGTGLPFYHELESLPGTMIDSASLRFEISAAEVSCDGLSCAFPSFAESKFTRVDISLVGSELHLSATSGFEHWLDTPSYRISSAVGTLNASSDVSGAAPEPTGAMLLVLGVAMAMACRDKRFLR